MEGVSMSPLDVDALFSVSEDECIFGTLKYDDSLTDTSQYDFAVLKRMKDDTIELNDIVREKAEFFFSALDRKCIGIRYVENGKYMWAWMISPELDDPMIKKSSDLVLKLKK